MGMNGIVIFKTRFFKYNSMTSYLKNISFVILIILYIKREKSERDERHLEVTK